jgi:acyl-CoA dehydrogenase
MALFALISGWLGENKDNEKLGFVTKPLQRGLDTLQQSTLWLAQNGIANPNHAGAGAVDYLRMMGIVVTGWMWGRMAKIAQEKLAAGATNKAFYEAKLVCARYWMERLMPECPMLFERIQAGSDNIMAYAPEMI